MSEPHDEPQRDPEMTLLLREHLSAPPLRAEFNDQLEARMEAADAARIPNIHSFDDRRRHRLPSRRVLALVAVIAAAAVLLIVLLPAVRGTSTATAADMLASMNAAAGSAQTVRLRIVEGIVPGTSASPESTPVGEQASVLRRDTTTELTLSTTGDFFAKQKWWTWLGDSWRWITSVFGYNERRHELRVYALNNGDGIEVIRPAWATDFPNIDVFYMHYQAAASSVRAELAEADPDTPVTETTYLGRPAWRATLKGPWPGDNLIVTVDKATGLLMATDQPEGGPGGKVQTSSLRVTRLEIDPQLSAGWQIVPLLKRTTPKLRWNYYRNEGTRFGTPQEVAKRSWPTLLLIPQWAPAGYRLTDVANAVYWDLRPGHLESMDWHWRVVNVPPRGRLPGTGISRRIGLDKLQQGVLVRFRRGFGTFVVEISPRLPGEPGMGKLTRDDRLTAEDVTLTGGYLKGARARTWISSATFPFSHIRGDSMSTSDDGPTLLTYDDRSMITIYGDLTRQELIDVANSFKAYGDVHKPLPPKVGQ